MAAMVCSDFLIPLKRVFAIEWVKAFTLAFACMA
jgi:hypothetical protein